MFNFTHVAELFSFNAFNEGPKIYSVSEKRLLECLRTWSVTMVTDGDQRVQSIRQLSELLEYYICECIRYGPKSLRHWWSDGVVHFEVTVPKPDQFNIVGVTWIDSTGLAPFEFELEMDPSDDTCFAKTTFRLGTLDQSGFPVVCNRTISPAWLLERRPRYNHDWAIAMELSRLNEQISGTCSVDRVHVPSE